MAVKTFTLTTTTEVPPASQAALLADGVDQTAATRTDGWTVAKTAAANSAGFFAATKRGSATFSLESSSPKPSSPLAQGGWSSFKVPNGLTGTFAATAWTFTFAVRATTASAQAGRVRMRVWKNTDLTANTTSTELTSAPLVGTTSSVLSTTADVTSVVTWNPGSITLAGEYLFFDLAWEITTAGGSNSSDVLFRTGQASGGTRIVTPDLAVTGAATLPTRPVVVGQAVGRGALV